MPAAYWCDHPECTGIHRTHSPLADVCPRTIARKRELNNRRAAEYDRKYRGTAKGILRDMRQNAKRRGT